MDQNPKSPSKFDTEKRRRNEMSSLYTELSSLVPHQSSREIISHLDQVEGATNYIKQLQTNLESLKKKKKEMVMMSDLKLPRIDLDFCGSTLDVVLITGHKCESESMFTHTLRILHEEGADVVSASFSIVDQSVFHTLHSKIGGCGLEYDAARISERLRKLVQINDDNLSTPKAG